METMGPALAPDVMRESYTEWEELREDMIDRCELCHSESYSMRELQKGDDLLRETDIAMARLIDLANILFNFMILKIKPIWNYYYLNIV